MFLSVCNDVYWVTKTVFILISNNEEKNKKMETNIKIITQKLLGKIFREWREYIKKPVKYNLKFPSIRNESGLKFNLENLVTKHLCSI